MTYFSKSRGGSQATSSYGRSYSGYDDMYGSYYDSWGLSDYSYFKDTDDDDATLIIKEAQGYDTPTVQDIKDQFMGDYRLRADNDTYKLVKNLSRYFYHEMVEDPDVYSADYKDPSTLDEGAKSEYDTMEEVIKKVNSLSIAGYSPLTKACNIIRMLNVKNENTVASAEDLAEADDEDVNMDSEVYMDAEMNNLADANAYSKKHKFKILNKISLMKKWGDKFKIKKEVDEKRVANSENHQTMRMQSFEEINQVLMYQRLLPTYKQKLATKDLNVHIPIESNEKQQKIIMLVDFSGSMDYDEKQQWVCAILLERLRYAIDGDCEIYFSFFVHRPQTMNFTHIHDKSSAYAFWAGFSTTPTGGDTELGHMVEFIHDEINNKGKLHNLQADLKGEKIEILAINDGQDDINVNQFAYKTNAITLMDGPNTELKDLCLDNQGKYIDVKQNGDIKEYE